MSASDEVQRRSSTWRDYARWTVAFLLTLAAAVLVVGSHYIDRLEVCETTETAQVTKESCKSFPVADALPLLALAVALMWKDLSEFELFGLGRIVRRLDQGQQDLRQGQERIEHQLITQSQVQNLNVYLGLAQAAGQTIREHPEAAQALTGEGWSDFERLWDEIEPWSELAARLRDPTVVAALEAGPENGWREHPQLAPSDRALLDRLRLAADVNLTELQAWATRARPRLEIARQIKQAVPAAPGEQLQNAAVVIRGLLAELEELGVA